MNQLVVDRIVRRPRGEVWLPDESFYDFSIEGAAHATVESVSLLGAIDQILFLRDRDMTASANLSDASDNISVLPIDKLLLHGVHIEGSEKSLGLLQGRSGWTGGGCTTAEYEAE